MRICLILAAALLAPPALGQNLRDYYQRVQDADPRLGIASETVRAAQAQQGQALGELLPRVTAQVGRNRSRRENLAGPFSTERQYFDGTRYALNVEQPVFSMPGVTSYRAAKALVRQTGFDATQRRSEVRFDVIDRYLAALSAAEKNRLARQEESAAIGQLEQARALYARQLVKVTDVLTLEVRVDLLKAARVGAEADAHIAIDELSELSGTDFGQLWGMDPMRELPLPGYSMQEAVAAALERNAELQALEQGVERAHLETQRRQWLRAPLISLQVSGLQSDVGYDNVLQPESRTGVLGLNLTWPLYSGGSVSAAVGEARALQRMASLELDAAGRGVRSATRSAYLRLQSLAAQVTAARQAVVSSGTSLEAADRAYGLGVITISDLLDARRDGYVAQRTAAEAGYEYLRQWAELAHHTGSLDDGVVGRLSEVLNVRVGDQ